MRLGESQSVGLPVPIYRDRARDETSSDIINLRWNLRVMLGRSAERAAVHQFTVRSGLLRNKLSWSLNKTYQWTAAVPLMT